MGVPGQYLFTKRVEVRGGIANRCMNSRVVR